MNEQQSKPAIIYCRVSDPKQATIRGDGLHSQERTCREFADVKGYAVVHVFTDMITGKQAVRPGLSAAKKYIRAHRGTTLIVDHQNRLGRDVLSYALLREEIRKMGGALACPFMDFGEDSSSQLMEHVIASVSQYQRQHNAEQTQSRMKARVLNGYSVFQAPVGYKYRRITGRGMVLTRHEPAATIVQEALEGYASGRFDAQADVMRFLQNNPLFPKDKSGIVRHQRVGSMLTQCLYAGYIEHQKWGVSLRPAQHEGLISFQTYQRIQDRLSGGFYAPRRKNLNEDFPLRGFVVCDDCDTPLTACWSKGTDRKHPYYLCPKRGCESYGKSIRRSVLEDEVETLLKSVTPSDKLFKVAKAMFAELWQRRASLVESEAKALSDELVKNERQVAQVVERILASSVTTVIAAYEEKVRKLEEEKHAIRERMASVGRLVSGFDETLRTALDFIGSPWNLWNTGRLNDRRTVLKLVFSDRLRYTRKNGLRTADLSMPFRLLGHISGRKSGMAHPARFERATFAFGGLSSRLFQCFLGFSRACQLTDRTSDYGIDERQR